MARIFAVVLFIQLIGCGLAAAQEPVDPILVRTEEVYKYLDTYHLRGVISYQWISENDRKQTYRREFQSFKGKEGRLRHQQEIGMSKVLAATDGIRSLLYLADRRQYQYGNSADLEGFLRNCLKLENTAWIFPTIAFLEKYRNLKARFHNPKFVSHQNLIVNGDPVTCFVLEGVMEPSDTDAVWGNRKTELWIDKDRYVVLRETSTGTSTDHPAKGEYLTETAVFDIVETNEDMDEAAFAFQPPPETKEVNEFFIPSGTPADVSFDYRAHPFYYELPFLQMKHFKLPTAGGQELGLDVFRGKYVLLDFWVTWCGPCHKQMEDLKKILREYDGKDVVVLGLNNEEMEITRDFLRENTPSYPMLIDVRGEISSLYGVDMLPVLVLLDRSGKIITKKTGRQTYKQIDQLLKEVGL